MPLPATGAELSFARVNRAFTNCVIGAAGNAHLYLVWDYRRATSFNFCYHASSSSNVCCSCNIPCPTCLEVQTTGVYVDFGSAC